MKKEQVLHAIKLHQIQKLISDKLDKAKTLAQLSRYDIREEDFQSLRIKFSYQPILDI